MNDAEFQEFLNAPFPLVIKPSATTKIVSWGMLAATIIFAIGEAMKAGKNHHDEFRAMLVIVGPIAVLISYFTMKTLCYSLILDHNGFAVKAPWRDSYYKWEDLSEFNVVLFSEGLSKGGWVAIIFFYCNGRRHAFPNPDCYNITGWQLAKALNHWRERALRPEIKTVDDVAASNITEHKASKAPQHQAPETW